MVHKTYRTSRRTKAHNKGFTDWQVPDLSPVENSSEIIADWFQLLRVNKTAVSSFNKLILGE